MKSFNDNTKLLVSFLSWLCEKESIFLVRRDLWSGEDNCWGPHYETIDETPEQLIEMYIKWIENKQ